MYCISHYSHFHYTQNIANGLFNWFYLWQLFTFYEEKYHIKYFSIPTQLYTTHSITKALKIFWSQCVLYFKLFVFPLHTQYSKIIFIYDMDWNFVVKDFLSNSLHYHNHLYCTFQFVIKNSLINNTISRGQLRAIECVMQ